jgi:hypothetical protein
MKKWWQNRKDWQKILLLFLVWRLGLELVSYAGSFLLPLKPAYFAGNGWANFDGMHYLSIAQDGYRQYQQAFFPLLPILIRGLEKIVGNYLLAGMLIANSCVLAALFYFYRLVKMDFGGKTAWRVLACWLMFPTSFFLGAVYTESLFIFLVIFSFYQARRRQWFWAGLAGGLASATRVVGVVLLPALLVEIYQQIGFRISWKKYWPIILVPAGLFFYMFYLNKTVGDPWYFVHVQENFAAGRTGGKIILLYQVFWRYLKMIATTRADILYLSVWNELIIGILFLTLSIWAFKRLRLSYAVFMAISYLIPTLSGTFLSLPRFCLTMFPGFVLLALMLEELGQKRYLYLVSSAMLLTVFTILFTRGYWVA